LRLRISLAFGLALAVAAGTAEPSSAALSGFWPFGKKEPAEVIPDPVQYVVTFMVNGADAKLEKEIRRASVLLERAKTPASGLTGLIARARQDVSRLTAVLYENARYSAEIAIMLDGRSLESVGPFDPLPTRPVPVNVRVDVGAPFVFGSSTVEPLPDGTTLESLGLVPGKPAGSAIIVTAEAKLADEWRQQGHPLAAIRTRDTIADHRTNTLDVTLSVDPGPLANFGRVEVTGTEAVNSDLVLRRSGIDGGLYSSKITRRAENRLRDLGVFESVRVTPGEALDPDGTIPITITVAERKRHVVGASVNYSNTEGLELEAFWRNRNLWGGAEQLEFRGSVARLLAGAFDPDYRLAGTFKKPAVFDPMTDFTLRLEGYRETTDAYRVTALEGEAGLNHIFSDTLTGSLGVEVARSNTVSATGSEDHLVTTLTGKLDWDTRDNRLDPSEGFRAQLMAAPAYDFLTQQPFATFRTDYATYWAFGEADRFVLAGRVAATVLAVDDVTNIAANKRIYAGGAGSIRGYAYQNVGPRDGTDTNVGGRSSLIVSGELRYRINNQFGLVGFVDAGNAFASVVPGLDFKVGVGVGLRYLTPVGPLRFDVAVPLQPRTGDPAVAFYVGLGQAF
jgi:translocation and assembly module TamA